MKPKKCSFCGNQFQPIRSTLEKVCSIQCAIGYNKEKEKQKELKAIRKKKEELLPRSFYEKKLQANINEIARLIDYSQPCISCGNYGKEQGGHYHSVGANASLRYNLHNIFLQCYSCNVHKSANTHNYDLGLIEIYGKEYWEYVKFQIVQETPLLSPTINELKEYIVSTRKVIKELKSDLKQLTPKQRIKLRTKLNERIGIYATQG